MAVTGMQQQGLVAAVINFNTAALTDKCTQSLLDAGIAQVLVLDNASAAADFAALQAALAPHGARARLVRSEENLGFARGYNRLIDEALRDPACRCVFLLNSDAVVQREGLEACLAEMARANHPLMGARMLKPGAAHEVDSLGITLYKSLLASNRQSTADAYLGPTGGFAIYTREFLEAVAKAHGYIFDPAFFCYAEDTDLCVRARMLGFAAGYSDAVAAHHKGQGSTDADRDEFILYHGIRNSIWMVVQSIPLRIAFTHLHWIVFLHGGIVLRHTLAGRFMTLVRLYVDAARGLPAAFVRRRAIKASRRIAPSQFLSAIDDKFYEKRYVATAIRELFRRPAN